MLECLQSYSSNSTGTSFPVANVTGKSPTSYEEVGRVASLLRGSWRLSDHLDMSRWSGVSLTSSSLVANLLRRSWRRRQLVCEEVTGKLFPVEFELIAFGEHGDVCSLCTCHFELWNALVMCFASANIGWSLYVSDLGSYAGVPVCICA